MFKDYEFKANGEHWGAAIGGGVLAAVPAAAWLYRGSPSWMDVVVAVIGTAMLVATGSELARSPGRARSGSEPLV
ncbi:MAG: hypothetical protein ACREU7_12295 [Burkholderiales bacterium]